MKLKKKIEKNLEKSIFFCDESRFVAHSKIGCAWFKTGERTPVNFKLGFKNFYLFSAVNPKTEIDFTLELSSINTDCMNIFLEKFVASIGDKKNVCGYGRSFLASFKNAKSTRKYRNYHTSFILSRAESSGMTLALY